MAMTKEQYLANITERIPVEEYPTGYIGYKRWYYQEDNISWDQISSNGKRYAVRIYNISWGNPPTSTQYFDWSEFVGPPEAPTDSIDIEEIPDDVAADSLEGMYNPPPLPPPPPPPPPPPIEIPKEASLTIIGIILGLILRFGRR